MTEGTVAFGYKNTKSFRLRTGLAVLMVLGAQLVFAQAARSTHTYEKFSAVLGYVKPGNYLDVIVQYGPIPTAEHYAKAAQLGGTTITKLPSIRGAAFHLPAQALKHLAADPDVVYISPDRPVKSLLSNAAPAINAPYAWGLGYDGSGIGVAVVDSGISDHDDLKDSSGHNRIVYQADFASDAGNADAYGHGTHVAGIIGGTGKDSSCSNCFAVIKGIAPNVTLVNLRALDKDGVGSDSSVINAINKANQAKNTYKHPVLNS